ncbi:MAG: type III PLP-dependent enzyme [Pseudomonadota bacterium]
MRQSEIVTDPLGWLSRERPDHPVYFFDPAQLQATARRFMGLFPGLVSYAVKANDSREVLGNLAAAGLSAFDVASPDEMTAVRQIAPGAALHYHNPVRSRGEITEGIRQRVTSWSVDDPDELAKLLAMLPSGSEIAVRLKLPVGGAVYDFGEKFGADPILARGLLRKVAEAGHLPSMTFHPGTQCTDPAAWSSYIAACADIARHADVRLERLNVGGGFGIARAGAGDPLPGICAAIRAAVASHFAHPPRLVCEPGRAMVAGAYTLAVPVKAVRATSVYLADGIYGGLSEAPQMGAPDRRAAIAPDGTLRSGCPRSRVVFGPTCDSLDRLPDQVDLPDDLAEGDYLIFDKMGAYSFATTTRFNGYGQAEVVTLSIAV